MADEQVYVGEEGAKELYRRIKSLIPAVDDSLDITSGNAISNRAVTEALGMVTSFVKAEGTGPDKHPDVENPSGRVIYLVHDELAPNPDQYKEWIWSTPPGEEPMWECIGDTSGVSGDSWKLWSENRDSYGDEESVYIGSNIVVEGTNSVAVGHDNTVDSESNNTSVFGKGNSVIGGNGNVVVGKANTVAGSEQEVFGTGNSSIGEHNLVAGENTSVSRDDTVAIGQGNQVEITDETDYSGTDVVEIGRGNTAINAAYAYQLGRENRVSGNNLENREEYPHGLSLNLGRNNTITGEGVNLGKDNTADTFGINVGQGNTAHNAAIVLGEDNEADHGSLAMGRRKVELYNSEYPSLEIDGKFYPIVVSSIPASPYVYTFRIGIDKDGAIQDISNYYDGRSRYGIVYNSITQKILVTEVDSTYLSFTDSRTAYGYTDDEGNFIETQVEPDPEHPIQQYEVYTFDDPENPGTSVTFVATWFVHTPDPLVPDGYRTTYRAKVYYEMKLGGIYDRDFLIDKKMWYPAVYSRNDSGAIWVDESGNRAFRCTYTTANSNTFAPKHTILVTGFDKDGTFYPYNGTNNDGATLYQKEFLTDQIVRHVYGGNEYEVLGIKPLDEYATWVPADNNSIAVGDAQKVRSNSVGVSSATAFIKMPSFGEGYNYTYKELTLSGEGEEFNQTPVLFAHNDVNNWPTPDSTPILDEVDGGSIGLFNGAGPTSSPSSIRLSSIGIGTANNAEGGAIVIGQGSSAYGNSMVFGTGGIYASGHSVAVGRSGVSAYSGSMIFGMNGGSASSGAMAVGFNNISSSGGSMALGFGSTASGGSLLLGGSGAYSNNGSIVVGLNSAYASNGSCAIGMSVYADQGAFVVGRNVRAENGGMTLGVSGNSTTTGRSATGILVKYKNPDNVYVPIRGNIRVKPGYTLGRVRVFGSGTYDNIRYDYAVVGSYNSSGTYNAHSDISLYKDGVVVGTVERTQFREHFAGKSVDYWFVYDTSAEVGTFVQYVSLTSSWKTGNIEYLKNYLQVYCDTFIKDDNIYVYAPGFNYPDTDLEARYVDCADCTYQTYDSWNYQMLGYNASSWNGITAMGGYNSGVAIGRLAHADGSSLSLGMNDANNSGGSAVLMENSMSNTSDGIPKSLNIRIRENYTHASGYSVALGQQATATGSSLAIGYSYTNANNRSLSIGCESNVADENSMAIGRNSNYAEDNSLAIGQSSNFATGYSFAIGTGANEASGYSFSVGDNNKTRDTSMSFGSDNNTEAYSFTVGKQNNSYNNAMSIGRYAKSFEDAIAIGSNVNAYNRSYAIGDNISAYDSSIGVGRWGWVKNYSVNFGQDNTVDRYSLGMGRWNSVDDQSMGIGDGNSAHNYAVALGRSNDVNGENIAVGISNTVNYDTYTKSYGVMVGRYNTSGNGGYNVGLGMYNRSDYEAITIGTSNTASGWSIAIGCGNSTPVQNGGHATILGYNNSSTSNLEQLNKAGSGFITTNSFIAGTNNVSRHYNSILIGSFNTSLEPLIPATGESASTNDDGYAIAMGFKNIVGRNYDIALGYMSTANGGENTAIHQSSATGFRNFALNKSTIQYGVSNFAINESSLRVPYNTEEEDKVKFNGNVTYNTLSYSSLETTSSMQYGCVGNDIKNTNITLSGTTNAFSRNIINIGVHGMPLSIDCEKFLDNIIIGGRRGNVVTTPDNPPYSGQYTIVMNGYGHDYSRNTLLNNAYQLFNGGNEGIQDNIICNSDLNIPAVKSLQGNACFDSKLDIATQAVVVENIILGKSQMYLRGGYDPVQYNFIYNSLLTDSSVGIGELDEGGTSPRQNVIFGTRLHNSNSCFSFTEMNTIPYARSAPKYITGNEAVLSSCRRVYNFGDNTITSTLTSFVEGLSNKLNKAERSLVLGSQNQIAGAYAHHFTVGNNIIGEKNNIYAYQEPTLMSGTDIRAAQIGGTVTKYKIKSPLLTAGYTLQEWDTAKFRVTSLNTNSSYAHIYDGDAVATVSDFSSHGITPTSISFADFQSGIRNGTLATNVAYRFTDASGYKTLDSDIVLYSGAAIYPDSVYNLEAYQNEYQGTVYHCLKVVKIEPNHEKDCNVYTDYATEVFFNNIIGNENDLNAKFSNFNFLLGSSNKVCEYSGTGSTSNPATGVHGNFILGSANKLHQNTMNYTIIGASNEVISNNLDVSRYDTSGISGGLVQGNNNVAKEGSNIVAMGNGNVATGHNSVAIGCQLISNRWQTVIGKYNNPIAGPGRIPSENPQDPDAALFIIGNGYSTQDIAHWQEEEYISRSNAMVVYADGTVRAKKFVSDDPELELVNGTGITFTDDTQNMTRTVSVDQNLSELLTLLSNRPATGHWTIQSVDGQLGWAQVGITTVNN